MELKKRFGKRKKSNSKRGLVLIILLAIVLYVFINAEKILSNFF